MTRPGVRVIDWPALARAEHEAAQIGGEHWGQFVREAEEQTGLSWSEIRVLVNPYVERYHAELGLDKP